MDLFLSLLAGMLPLYVTLLIAYVVGRATGIQKDQIAKFSINMVTPVVFAGVLWRANIDASNLFLPAFNFATITLMTALTWWVSGFFWRDQTRNLMTTAMAVGNTGYFGLPIALSIFAPDVVGLYTLTIMANSIFLVTVGYYVLALGDASWRVALRKLLRLPPLYGAVLGLVLNFSGVDMPAVLVPMLDSFKGALTVLGMTIIGLALAEIRKFEIDWGFITVSLAIRFLAWPALVFGLIATDLAWMQWLTPAMRSIFILISVLPIAADTAAYATQLKIHPEKAATAILATTLIALVLIPAVYAVLL